MSSTRRDFLLTSTAATLATLLPGQLNAQAPTPPQYEDADASAAKIPTLDTTLKFNPDGTRRGFAGNTVICHLPQQSDTRDAITALGDALRTAPYAAKLGVLPADSYHMTVFPGANDQGRSMYGWPAGLPIDAPIAECNRVLAERVANFRMHADMPIRISVSLDNTLAYGRASTLRLSPADDAENKKLRTLRDRLASDVFRFRNKDHATYAFHMTIAYQMTPFTPQEQQQYHALLEKHIPAIIATAPVIELGVPEFCTFEDMYRFNIVHLLRS